MKNYYEILGVTPDASPEEIKVAYRKLSQKFHPDKNAGDRFYEEHFKQLREAYEILSAPDKRSTYDESIHRFFAHNQEVDANKELNARERELLKQEIDLRRKMQQVEAEKIHLQRKLYEQFRQEKDELYEQFRREKEQLQEKIITPQAAPPTRHLGWVVVASVLVLLMLGAVYAAWRQNSPTPSKSSRQLSLPPTVKPEALPPVVQEKQVSPQNPPLEQANPQNPPPRPTYFSPPSAAPKQREKTGKPDERLLTALNAPTDLFSAPPRTSRDMAGNEESPRLLVHIPEGQQVEVLSEPSAGGYVLVAYLNYKGYLHTSYLNR